MGAWTAVVLGFQGGDQTKEEGLEEFMTTNTNGEFMDTVLLN